MNQIMGFVCRKIGGDAGGAAKLTIAQCSTNWTRANRPTEGKATARGEQKVVPPGACRGCSIGESHAKDGKAANGVRLVALTTTAAPPPSKPAALPPPERAMPVSAPETAPRKLDRGALLLRASETVRKFQAAGAQPRYPAQLMDELCDLVERGEAMSSIAAATGIPANTIAIACRKRGIRAPRRRHEKPEELPAAPKTAPTPPAATEQPEDVACQLPATIERRTILSVALSGDRRALVSLPEGYGIDDLVTTGHAIIGQCMLRVRGSEGRKT